jgi:hypothetical protein
MIRLIIKQLLSLSICGVLASGPFPIESNAQQAPTASSNYGGQGAPQTPAELQALVAPIALYPDALVAQILGAATFPDQVAVADYWLQQNKNLSGNALMQAADKQSWDPSVKALTQFPSVLDNMAKNLSWVSSLGEAYHTQTSDVMSAIQALRAKAQAAGNLKSGSQITVVQQSPQTIVIQPTNPQVVYVPQYNPTVIYGTTYVTPGYSTGDLVATSVLSFGAGLAVGALISGGGGCCGWGWNSWNCNWHGGTVIYNQNNFYGNSAWHGGYYGGYNNRGGYYGTGGSAYGPNGSAHYGSGYNPTTGTYARGASSSTAYGSQRVGQAYNPSTGAYGATHQASNGSANWGSSVASRNGESAYSQHYSNAQGSVGTMQTSYGGHGAATSTAYGNSAVGKTSNGDQYAEHNGTDYRNTGSGWQKDTNGSWNNVNKPSGLSSSDEARGWGSRSSGGSSSSAFSGYGNHSGSSGGGDGWASRSASSRGWGSRGGGGGWGSRGGGGLRR